MRVAVFGANGQIGQHIIQQLSAHPEHEEIALVRKQDQLEAFQKDGVNATLTNLTDNVSELSQSLKGADAVIFSAGSGGNTGSDMTLQIDLDGAVKAMEAAQLAGIKRFVIVSALQAHNREFWPDEMAPYYIAKHYADRELMRSGLDYTIVRPGLLTNDEPAHQVQTGDSITEGQIARADVAETIVELIDKPNAAGKAFDLVSGDIPIKSAVSKL